MHLSHWRTTLWRRSKAAALAALLGAVAVPAVTAGSPVRAANVPDRVVRGTIAVPGVALPAGATGRCMLSGAGIPGSEWVIEGVVPGRSFSLTADGASWNNDFDIAFYPAGAPRCNGQTRLAPLPGHRNFGGDEHAVVPPGAAVAVVVLEFGSPGAAFTFREFAWQDVKLGRPGKQKPTVVAVIELGDSGLSPYHFDFAGHQHPWNLDEEGENNIDFYGDPAEFVPGYPKNTVPLSITVPKDPDQQVDELYRTTDKEAWESMRQSTASSTTLYRLPGTKVIGTIQFAANAGDAPGSGSTYADNESASGGLHLGAHGSQASAVAVGNTLGTCPECLLVFLNGDALLAQKWAAAQPWIDVVTNSYGSYGNIPVPADRYVPDVTRPAVESGQTWVWSSGNGLSVAHPSTYALATKGPDWIVTTGAVSPNTDEPHGSGMPVDITSYGDSYPTVGGNTATGKDQFGGTSNAAPVVAGTLARVIQWGRTLLGDVTPGHANGIVAEGPEFSCVSFGCPLGDGKLSRAEAQAIVFGNVVPSPPRYDRPTGAINGGYLDTVDRTSAGHRPMRQGHGILRGRLDDDRFAVEQRRFFDVLRGAEAPLARPPGERNWMIADSLCRQRLWGLWTGGYYVEDDPLPQFDPVTDQAALAFTAACTPLPNGSARAIFDPSSLFRK